MSKEPTIHRATEQDLSAVAKINAGVFLGNRDHLDAAKKWISTWFQAYPIYHLFVLKIGKKIIGYTGWQVHGGFQRAEPSIELEQIGVHADYQGRGYAHMLITDGFRQMTEWMQQTNSRIESHITFFVWAYALNDNATRVYAQHFTEGIDGFRTQYGRRSEVMYRVQLPMIRPRRDP